MAISIPPRVLEAARNKRLIPFVGAGLSKQVSASQFPTWDQLLNILIKHGAQKSYLSSSKVKDLRSMLNRGKHLLVAQEIKENLPVDEYRSILQHEYTKSFANKPTPAHKALLALKPPFIITTNYDRIIEDSYAAINRRAMTVLKFTDADSVQRRIQQSDVQAPFLFKIHGDIEDMPNVILTESDYRRILYDENGYRLILSSIFIHYVVLMVGFSLHDRELLMTLENIRHSLKDGNHPDFALCPEGQVNPTERERYRKNYGVEIIEYSSDPTHGGAVKFLSKLATAAKSP